MYTVMDGRPFEALMLSVYLGEFIFRGVKERRPKILNKKYRHSVLFKS